MAKYAAPMSIEVRQAFGKRVRTLRQERNFTLRQFALTIGIDKSFLVDIEYGRKAPTLDTIERIAGGLDVTMSHLMFNVDVRHVGCENDSVVSRGGSAHTIPRSNSRP